MSKTQTSRITASKVRVGDVIRKYAPYKYWLDFQAVAELVRDGSHVTVTRTDGKTETFSASSRFEIKGN